MTDGQRERETDRQRGEISTSQCLLSLLQTENRNYRIVTFTVMILNIRTPQKCVVITL